MAKPNEAAHARRDARARMARMQEERKARDAHMEALVTEVLMSAGSVDSVRQQLLELEERLRATIEEHQATRVRAIKALKDDGASYATIADLLDMSQTEIKRDARRAPANTPSNTAPAEPIRTESEGEHHV